MTANGQDIPRSFMKSM